MVTSITIGEIDYQQCRLTIQSHQNISLLRQYVSKVWSEFFIEWIPLDSWLARYRG